MTVELDQAPESNTVSDAELTAIDVFEEIEAVIASMDHSGNAMVNRGEHGRLWKFSYGSVEVFVQITGKKEEDSFTTWASLLPMPAKNEAKLMRQVLEMNWNATLDAKFAIMGNRIVIVTSRPVADLSPSEISRSITLVATLADDHDDAFKAEYGS
jgi:hypothetical protein